MRLRPRQGAVNRAARLLERAERPLLMVGSQAMIEAGEAADLASAVVELGVPVYLAGMARGLLGRGHPLHLRHKRSQALRQADLVVLAGVPFDFRLNYGRHIPRRTRVIAANRGLLELHKNRRPDLPVLADPGLFVRRLGREVRRAEGWSDWLTTLRERDDERNVEIAELAGRPTDFVNPVALCLEIEAALDDDMRHRGSSHRRLSILPSCTLCRRPVAPSWLSHRRTS